MSTLAPLQLFSRTCILLCLRGATIALAIGVSGGPLRAETFDYANDPKLAAATVTVESSPVALGSLLPWLEETAGLQFAYLRSELPLTAEIALPTGQALACSEVLWQTSRQARVVFRRVNGQFAVRVMRSDDTLVAPPSPKASAVDDVVVMEKVTVVGALLQANSREAFTEFRREASVPLDIMSAQDFNKFAVTNVAEAMVRMPGVSVSTKGSFAVVRGLAERYNTVTVNGLVMPSSDPERQSVELDQFPTRLLDGLIVYKAFSPELPGNLSGGGFDIRTLTFPKKRVLSVSLGTSLDDGVFNGEDYLTYRTTGSGDRWGLGAKDRISTDDAARHALGDTTVGSDVSGPLTAQRKDMPIGRKFGFYYGDTFALAHGRELGVGFGLSYDLSYSTTEGAAYIGDDYLIDTDSQGNRTVKYTLGADGNRFPRSGQYSYLRSSEQVLLGALASVSYRWGGTNQVGIVALSTQSAEDRAEYQYDIIDLTSSLPTPGAHETYGTDLNSTANRWRYRLSYRERNLSSLSLSGDHTLPFAGGGRLTWSAAATSAYQDEPNLRSYTYFQGYNETQYRYISGTDYGFGTIDQAWRKVEEYQKLGQLTFRQPLWQGAFVEAGVSGSTTHRTYTEVIAHGVTPSSALVLDQPEDISTYAGVGFYNPDTVSQDRKLRGYFARVDLPLGSERLRLAGGVRWETTDLAFQGFGRCMGSGEPSYLHYLGGNMYTYWADVFPANEGIVTAENIARISRPIRQTDGLPSASLTYSPTQRLSFRASASQTIARPSLREYGNYYTYNLATDTYQHGNTASLKISDVRNCDFRAEYFFQDTDVIALSAYYKEIDRPIEKKGVAAPIGGYPGVETWFNNPHTAYIHGFELELRKNLGFLGDWGRPFTLGGNASLIESKVDPMVLYDMLGNMTFAEGARVESGVVTKWWYTSRRLYDQPRWLYNVDATYESRPWGTSATLSFVASSEVLDTIGGVQWGSLLRDETTRLDLAVTQPLGKRLKLRFTAKNLLDPTRAYIRDPDHTGGVRIVERWWKDGRSFSATLSADF